MTTYLLRGQRQLKRWAEKPGVREAVFGLFYFSGGFLLSAAGLREGFQPISSGLVLALTGWRTAVLMLGSMAGYRVFWGRAGLQGAVWSAVSGLLALALGKQKWFAGLLVPLVAAAVTAATGLGFQIFRQEEVAISLYFVRILTAAGAAALWHRVLHRRDGLTDWLAGGLTVLALAQVMPIPGLGLGYLAAAVIGVTSSFPAAAIAGVGLDLAEVTRIPMAAVLCGAWFLRLLPIRERWPRYAAPAMACAGMMLFSGRWDLMPLPGLLLGGALGMVLPPRTESVYSRGPTGAAQVRLELSARVMTRLQQILLEQEEPAIDQQALVEKAKHRACSRCPDREACAVRFRLGPDQLADPLGITCRKTARLIQALRRSQEQLKILKSERSICREYRQAMLGQYRVLSGYLQQLADQMPRKEGRRRASYCIEVSARSRKKEAANGDRCLAFPGTECRYYVLLCDGMGTGLGAAEESKTAGTLLRQMLCSGFSPDSALRTLNSVLALRGMAGAVTVDLVEVRLDTGRGTIYKWGAAPSWLLKRRGYEKIGTATPPPGISVTETRETVMRLSLSRGEVLILLSDGVDGEGALRRLDLTPEAPPGELAEHLLGSGKAEDDATAAVIRLRFSGLAP